jgi:hypothetical protein
MSDEQSHQLPSNLVAAIFGEVNVARTATATVVEFLMNPTMEGAKSEGWQTGVALDASASMRNAYGRGIEGKIPPEIRAQYEAQGLMTEKVIDGSRVRTLSQAAHRDALAKGYIKTTANVIEPLAREFVGLLAERLDEDGGTTVVYWATGDGTGVEVLGDYRSDECRKLKLAGPKQFGTGTKLLPAVKYFVDRFHDAKKGIYVFLADGNLDDLEEVKAYTAEQCRAIEAGRRHFFKCVLVGIGDEIDEDPMEELDDLDTGTGVDIWDHKIAREMRSLNDIFAELVDDNTIVAPWAKLYDGNGKLVKKFTTGLPARVRVSLPAGSAYFELETPAGRTRQVLAES